MHATAEFLTDNDVVLAKERYLRFERLHANPEERPRCKECGTRLNYTNDSGYCGAHRHLRPVDEDPYAQSAAGPGNRGGKKEMEYLICINCERGFARAAAEVRAARNKGRTEFCCSQSCSGGRNAGKPRRRRVDDG